MSAENEDHVSGRPDIRLHNLEVGYRTTGLKKQKIYGPVNLELRVAEMIGIIGRNGIGKSTLLRTVAGLQAQVGGEVLIDGIEINRLSADQRAKKISYVSTEHVNLPQITVLELIALGRLPHTGWFGNLNKAGLLKVYEAAELTGVMHLIEKSIHALSDGERQKVMISRALAQDTPVIILDEPTAFLDLPSRYEVLRILSELTVKNRKTVLFSTHDLTMAMDISDKIWLMTGEDICEGAPEDLLISKVFRKLFLNSPAEFDQQSSTFRFKKEFKNEVALSGTKNFRTITSKAMERIGFRISEHESCKFKITIKEINESPCWHYNDNNTAHTFHTLYDLATYMKSINDSLII
jgi:iron complex transport system ATP-binding protein